MRTLRSIAVVSTLLLASLGVSGCKDKDAEAELPPATGEGAPPLPELPQVDGPAGTGSGAASGSAPTAVQASAAKTTGTLVARAEIGVGPKAAGLITKIAVAEGQTVKKGDLLFRTDASNAVLMRDQAKAAVASAQVQVDAAQVEHDRAKALFDKGALNKAQLDRAVSALAGANAGVQSAKALLALAQKQISDATVNAPMKGIIIKKLMNEGEYAQMMPPSIVVMIQDRSTLELQFRLTEAALAGVKKDDEITAAFTSIGVTRTLKITRINPTVDPRTRTFELVCEIDNTDDSLKPGLLAEITLGAAPPAETKPAEPAPAVPAAPATADPAAKPAEVKTP